MADNLASRVLYADLSLSATEFSRLYGVEKTTMKRIINGLENPTVEELRSVLLAILFIRTRLSWNALGHYYKVGSCGIAMMAEEGKKLAEKVMNNILREEQVSRSVRIGC